MGETRGVIETLANPYAASYGDRWERLLAAVFVGTLTGVTAAMAMYVHRLPEFSLWWASGTPMLAVVFVGGALTKLLVGQMRTSVTAIILATFLGAGLHILVEVVPFYLLGIPTGGVVLYVPLRDVFTFLILFQVPLQFAGYLSAVVYEGLVS